MSAPFYITTPIYYVNDVPHLGHAYTTIAADALARYHRARGHQARFLTGTDEHGEKIEEVAKARNITPIEHADRVVERFRATWRRLAVANDDFIRTTEKRHEDIVRDMWKRLEAAGDIYLGHYEGLYCVSCEAFYTEGQLDPGNLCPTHKREVQLVKEPSYFFRMSRYQDRLLAHFEANPQFVRPESRRNEILSFIRSGLNDLSVSRTSFTWGIPVPGDDKHIIYVWIDALTNYVSALGGPGQPLYEQFWPQAVHLIGKDILRFHAVYWPCMLLSAGLPLPRTIFAHGWWTIRGEKISKSLPATRVDPNQLAEDIGADAFRYFLLREVPLGLDGDFSYESLIGRINSDLANDLGNLLNRTLSMTEKYVAGVIPAATGLAGGLHGDLAQLADRSRGEAERHFDAMAPSKALEAIWDLVRGANQYVDKAGPWTLAKDPARKAELDHVIHSFLEAAYWAALLVWPVMPAKAEEIFAQLGLDPAQHRGRWPATWNAELPAGGRIAKGTPLFPRIDEARQAELLERWIPKDVAAPAPAPAPVAPVAPVAPAGATVTYDEFARLDLRVAVVLSAERVPKADKLLKLVVDVGGQQRQVVAGVAETYAPEQLIGKRVIFLANLKPAKIRGIESQGMILAAGEEKVVALSALDQEVPAGTKVR